MIKDNEKTNRNIEQAYNDKKYIVSGRKIYQPHYSVNAGYYAQEVFHSTEHLPLTSANRYFHYSAKEVNDLIGFNRVIEL